MLDPTSLHQRRVQNLGPGILDAQRRGYAPAALRAASKRQSGEYKRRSHQRNVSEVCGINPATPTNPRAASVAATPAAPILCSRGLFAGQPATRLPPTVSNAATTRQAPADGISSSPITALASRLSSAAGQDDPRAQFACIAAKEKRTPAPRILHYFLQRSCSPPFSISSLCTLGNPYRAITLNDARTVREILGLTGLPLAP